MLSDSLIVPECMVRPGSFGGLMALYESNYIKLSQLVGDANQAGATYRSGIDGDCVLQMCVDTCVRYTRDLRLTYLFDEPEGRVAEPDMTVRVYLDARMSEVLGWAEHQRHPLLTKWVAQLSRELDRRWSHNMVLSKWLDYLLDSGHRFESAPAAQCAAGIA